MTLIAEFSIHDLPLMTNGAMSKHWTAKHRERIKWQRLVSVECLNAKIMDLKLNSAILTLTRHSFREPDFDGLVSGFKGVIDSLVKCGVIVDDKPSVIGESKFVWKYAPKKPGGFITVKIETA